MKNKTMNRMPAYPERESKSLEFKSRLPKFDALVRTCIAFANGAGGRIVLGVEDGSRHIIGIDDEQRNRVYDRFPNSLYDAVSPNLFARIYEKYFDSLAVMVIEIPPGFRKPYFLKREGLPGGVYLRVGSSTRGANPEYVQDLVREGQRITYDEEIVTQAVLEALSKPLLKRFYHPGNIYNKRLIADKIAGLSPAGGQQMVPTVAGILMFCESPHNYLPEACVICTRFSGNAGRDIIQTEEVTGDLIAQADVSFNLVNSWLTRNYVLRGARLRGVSPVPPEALREAIVNALVHRKYSIPGAIKIAIYNNHLEVFSPGGFPGLVDLNNLSDGITYLRNPILARLARKVGLVEKLGSGIRLIFDSCLKLGVRAPQYFEDGDFVKVVFHFEPARDLKSTDLDQILRLAEMRGELTVKEVMQYLDVSRNTASRKLGRLVTEQRLIRYGKGPAARFALSG